MRGCIILSSSDFSDALHADAKMSAKTIFFILSSLEEKFTRFILWPLVQKRFFKIIFIQVCYSNFGKKLQDRKLLLVAGGEVCIEAFDGRT